MHTWARPRLEKTFRMMMAPSSSGSPKKMSVTRAMSTSNQPPKKPASAPRTTPMRVEPPTTTKPMIIETRAP